MYNFICKFCNENICVENVFGKGGHIAMCISNPKFKDTINKRSQKMKITFKNKVDSRKEKYDKDPRSCQNCSNLIIYEKRNNKFCSQSCSAIYTNQNRIRSEESLKIQKDKLKSNLNMLNCWKNLRSEKNFEKRICLECDNEFECKCDKTNKYCSRKCGSKATMRRMILEGTHKGFASRKDKEPSWAEKFVMDKFDSLNIVYDREFKINKFFGDFVFKNLKLVLEIDGNQHKHPDRIIADNKRDEIIKSEGWKIIRIDWEGRNYEKMHNKIENFIKEYLNTCIV